MRQKPLVLLTMAALLLLVAMAFAPGAFAGTLTKIMYAQESITYYSYTPSTTGTLNITLNWSKPDGTGAPVYPIAECDAVVQTYDSTSGELYYDIDVSSLYSGTNPQSGAVTVKSAAVGKAIYIGVEPYIGDIPYHITATWTPTGGSASTVIDQTGMAYASEGEAFVPSTAGSWHSVLQTWPGTLNRSTGTSNVLANWDDYVWDRTNGTNKIVDNYSVEYVPPVVSDNNNMSNNLKNQWYTIGPEIWTAAAVPNVWTNISTDLYPKPGSLTYTQAPAWYTYAYTDSSISDANTKPAYFWGNMTNAAASQRNYSSTVSTAGSFSATFYGTSITWVYTKSSAAGVAKVSIDGNVVGTVDQYSPTIQYQQSTTFSGLTNGTHTILVENNKTKNASSSSTFITHDKFIAFTDAADTTNVMENNYDGSTSYQWGKVTNAAASGGSYCSEVSTSAALAFTFSGTSITWKYTKTAACGIARVYIDGVDKGTVDQYSPTIQYQQTTTYSGLPSGLHTILILNNKTKNASSSSTFITHDAFVVGGVTYEN